MFNWVCPRCGHDVPPSKTECPLCFPPVQESAPPPQQYAPPQAAAPPQAPPPQAPPPQVQPPQYPAPGQVPQYSQQAPPQYWQPQGQPPAQYPPPQYGQQAPPQYWPPQQYPPQQPQYPQQPPYQPPPPPPAHEAPVQHYAPPPPVAEYRQPERGATPWPPPEERTAKPTWLVATLAFAGVLAVFGAAYFLMGSHGSSSSSKDAAKQQTTNPLQKYVEVVGIRLVSAKGGQAVKFLVVNHSGVELTDLAANVTLYASTQRSEEDAVGTFTFKTDSIGPNESKEMTAPLKTDKRPSELPDDWRNISADVQVQGPQ